jgi:hypothetical protein
MARSVSAAHHTIHKEARRTMPNTTRIEVASAQPVSPAEHIPWYIIVSKLSLAVGTTLAMLGAG